jgi:hypothetical protein
LGIRTRNKTTPVGNGPRAVPGVVAVITQGTGQNAPTLVDYTYLGLDTIIGETHPRVSGGLDFSLGTVQNGHSGWTGGAKEVGSRFAMRNDPDPLRAFCVLLLNHVIEHR